MIDWKLVTWTSQSSALWRACLQVMRDCGRGVKETGLANAATYDRTDCGCAGVDCSGQDVPDFAFNSCLLGEGASERSCAAVQVQVFELLL